MSLSLTAEKLWCLLLRCCSHSTLCPTAMSAVIPQFQLWDPALSLWVPVWRVHLLEGCCFCRIPCVLWYLGWKRHYGKTHFKLSCVFYLSLFSTPVLTAAMWALWLLRLALTPHRSPQCHHSIQPTTAATVAAASATWPTCLAWAATWAAQ